MTEPRITDDDLEILRDIPVLGGLLDSELTQLGRYLHRRTYETGTDIVRESEIGKEMYFVVSGRVDIVKSGAVIGQLGEGACFGEMSMIDIQPRSATARAADETTALVLSYDDLIRVYRTSLETYALIVLNVARQISHRLREANGVIAGLGHPVIPTP